MNITEPRRTRLAELYRTTGDGATSLTERRSMYERQVRPEQFEDTASKFLATGELIQNIRRARFEELTESIDQGKISITERRQLYEGERISNESGGSSSAGLVSLAVFEKDKFNVNDKELQRFLKRDELRVDHSSSFPSPWENPDWFGEVDDKITDGFEWRRGSVACTKRIHVWSEVFHVPLNDGREAAILLVDTQGLFDDDTSPDTNAKIMSISTLFSSHQILNLMRQIEERDLEHLSFAWLLQKRR